jgi:hypothetical protein
MIDVNTKDILGKYEIILTTWYQETPNKTYEEVYHGMGFDDIEDACEFLGNNYEKILDYYPVESIKIVYNHLHKPLNVENNEN